MLTKEQYERFRPYQKEAFDFMTAAKAYIRQPNTISAALNYDDMGLGKTLVTLSCLEQFDAYPCLIVAPKFALLVWEDEIRKWFGYDCVIYSGKPKDRAKQWQDFVVKGHKFLITNYGLLPEVAARSGIKKGLAAKYPTGTWKWQGIVCDEIHLAGLLNHKTGTYDLVAAMSKMIPVRYFLTGTPYRKGCINLFPPLSLVDNKVFDSYWSFVGRYCVTIKTPFGKEIERNPANIEGFRAMIRKYMIRRLKPEVEDQLPGKWRMPLYIEMNDEQRKVYDELTENLIAEIAASGGILLTPNQMTLIIRQRQLLACPQVLGLKGRGAAIDTIIEHSHLRLDEERPVVVFTPFRQALPYVRQAFEEEYPGCKIYEIKGQMTADEFGDSWKGFQTDKHPHKILLCVIKSSASFHATVSDLAYFLGYEEDFNLNEQAEDRLNRMGQKNLVNIYYLMTKGTVDEEVAARLNSKKSSADWVVGTETQYLQMLKQLRKTR